MNDLDILFVLAMNTMVTFKSSVSALRTSPDRHGSGVWVTWTGVRLETIWDHEKGQLYRLLKIKKGDTCPLMQEFLAELRLSPEVS